MKKLQEQKQKILIINSCWECYYRDRFSNSVFCRLKHKHFISWIKYKFPKWCPLPTYKKNKN